MNKKNIKRNILKKTKMGVAVSQIVLMTGLQHLVMYKSPLNPCK